MGDFHELKIAERTWCPIEITALVDGQSSSSNRSHYLITLPNGPFNQNDSYTFGPRQDQNLDILPTSPSRPLGSVPSMSNVIIAPGQYRVTSTNTNIWANPPNNHFSTRHRASDGALETTGSLRVSPPLNQQLNGHNMGVVEQSVSSLLNDPSHDRSDLNATQNLDGSGHSRVNQRPVSPWTSERTLSVMSSQSSIPTIFGHQPYYTYYQYAPNGNRQNPLIGAQGPTTNQNQLASTSTLFYSSPSTKNLNTYAVSAGNRFCHVGIVSDS
jgi:hypothetical protein